MKQRSRIIAAVLVSAVLAFFAGFSVGHEEGRKTQPEIVYAPTFYATIEDVESWGENALLVQGLDINNWNHRSKYILWNVPKADLIWHGTKIKFNQFKAGQTVSITFDGTVAESYPAQISNIYRIEILDDDLSTEIQPVSTVPELSAQEIAQRAYEQILGFLGPIYPAEFAGAYYREPMLVVCLTDTSAETQEKYRAMTDVPHILEFQQVKYSYNDLNDLQNAILKTKGMVFSSVGIDIKANRICVGIPDLSTEAETLSLITDQLPESLKNRFPEYPIVFEEESFVTLD